MVFGYYSTRCSTVSQLISYRYWPFKITIVIHEVCGSVKVVKLVPFFNLKISLSLCMVVIHDGVFSQCFYKLA